MGYLKYKQQFALKEIIEQDDNKAPISDCFKFDKNNTKEEEAAVLLKADVLRVQFHSLVFDDLFDYR